MRAAVLLLAIGLGALPARGIDLETLVMPGPVIEGHADIEEQCTKCHQPFDRASEDALCLECHDDVGADLRAAKGFHGKAPGLAAAPCRSCHTDHEGRAADIVGLNAAVFDHGLTDYPLHGAHVAVPCASCHTPDDKHRDAPSDCIACHRADDVHKGGLGEDCASCHEDAGWKQASFDHGETDFPLEGAHVDVACRLCHADEKFEGTPQDCATCHVQNDVHRRQFGTACGDCHGVAKWDEIAFDHDRDTKFRLTGKHASAACGTCHTGPLYDQALPSDCLGCHEVDDVHRGRNGKDCQDCHDTRAWATIDFDHDKETEFPLHGLHAEVACEGCHRGNVHEEKLGVACIDCHRKDDVHRGEQGEDCARCHGETGWAKVETFDHELTRFPLLGLHATVACEECHESHQYQAAETDCSSCHRKDDEHETRLGNVCGQCHNPNGWGFWRFDHTKQTRFELHGAHDGVDCTTCHAEREPRSLELPQDCATCHFSDDVHRGGFGRDCARCHNDEDWKKVRIGS